LLQSSGGLGSGFHLTLCGDKKFRYPPQKLHSPRISIPDAVYHVTSRGWGRERLKRLVGGALYPVAALCAFALEATAWQKALVTLVTLLVPFGMIFLVSRSRGRGMLEYKKVLCLLLAAVFSFGTVMLGYFGAGGGVKEVQAAVPDGIYFYYNDHLGTPLKMVDEGGAVVWSADYLPFGLATVDPASSVESNWRFPGQFWDGESGLHYNYQRTCHPGLGRYLEPDPLGEWDSSNVYLYVGSNPITVIDPWGLAGCYVGFPGYPIAIPGTRMKVPLTHAGVLSYDSQGKTRYYEYGRYDSDFGQVHRRKVPDLEMGPDGKPTPESWSNLQDALNKIGHGTEAKASCDDEADENKINSFAEQRMNDPNRAPYSWNPFNFNACTTFASDALEAGLK